MKSALSVALLALALCACSARNRNVDTSKVTPTKDAGSAKAAKAAPSAGAYQCTWRQDGTENQPSCKIQFADNKKTFVLTMSQLTLQGTASATDYGFHFIGTLQSKGNGSEAPLEAEFFRQGEGAYSAVLTLKDKSLVKLDLQP